MEQSQNVSSGDNQQASGDVENKANVNQSSNSNNTVAYASYEKLLKEKKSQGSELERLRAFEKAALESKQLEEGKHTELIQTLRNENKELKDTISNGSKKAAYEKFISQVKSKAATEGCKDTDTLVALLTKKQIESVQIDENGVIVGEDLNRLMDGMKEKHKNISLFGQKSVNHHALNSVDTKVVTGAKKATSKMTAAEMKEHILNTYS